MQFDTGTGQISLAHRTTFDDIVVHTKEGISIGSSSSEIGCAVIFLTDP